MGADTTIGNSPSIKAAAQRITEFSQMKNKAQAISVGRSAINGVAWLSVTKFFGQSISWIITIYIARILSPVDYGLMGMAAIIIAFMLLFNELGLGTAIIQASDLSKDDLVTLHWTVAGLNTVLYLIVYSLAPSVAAFFHEARITSIIRVLGLNFLINSIGFVSFNMLAKSMNFRSRSIAEFIASLAGSISTLYFAVKGSGVWSLVLGSIVLETTRNFLLQIFYPWIPGFSYSYQSLKKFTRFGSQIMGSRILWYLYSNSDKLIVGKVLGKSALGYYSLAMQFAMMPLEKIITLVNQITLPAFSQVQHDHDLMRKYFLKIIRFISLLTFPLFLGIIMVADEAVLVLLTDKWSSVILPLKILCLVSVLRAMNTLYTSVFLAKGKANEPLMNNLLLAILMPIGFYFGSIHGLIGFSVSWIIVFPIPFMIITWKLLKLLNISFLHFLHDMQHFFFGSLFMIGFIFIGKKTLFHNSADIINLIGSSSVGLISYCLYQFIFNQEIISEAKMVWNRGKKKVFV